MKVSVIIPIYNTAPYLANCLESCITQTYHNLEIICVNDGSTDNSPNIIRQYKEQDSRIIQVDKINGGLPLARRSGLEAATGDYIFHLDGDDNLPPDTIASLVVVAKTEDADIVIGDFVIFQNNKAETVNFNINKPLTSIEYLCYILEGGRFNIWGKLIKRSIYIQNPIEIPADIIMAEDLVACFQLAYYAKRIVPCHELCYNYYVRMTSMSKDDKSDVGLLTNRSIKAVCFVVNAYKRYALPELKHSMQIYLTNFLFVYLCSPYSINLHKERLKALINEVDGKYVASIAYTLKKITLKIARYNLCLAKAIARSATITIRVFR